MKEILLEVCIDSVASAIAAEEGGAQRVELCANLFAGGTTPNYGMIKKIRDLIEIDLNVMIRPRGGDFCYSDLEFEVMKENVIMAKELGVDGVVLGILNPDGSIDMERTKALVELARPMSVTFHRAFDMTVDPHSALEDIISLDIDRLLTSGQETSALLGSDLIAELIQEATGRIIIMPGAGIRERNIDKLIQLTQAQEYHVSARKRVPSRMEYRKQDIFMGGSLRLAEYQNAIVDPTKVTRLITK